MENRKYNIFFHLHTVSGITISVVLFVIFFAGSFAFFRDDINNWQRNQSAETDEFLRGDFDNALQSLDTAYVLKGRTIELTRPHAEPNIVAHMDETKDSTADKKARIHQYLYVNTKTYKAETYDENYGLGEFLYRLHFLAQIPYPYGYWLAGFVALFFLFAIITGVLVHWKKIIPNFYTFRPKEKLKTLWTDSHTALGMIGLPFQFVYALTGTFFLINIFLVAPSVMTFFGGDSEKLYHDLGFVVKPAEFTGKPINQDFSINLLAQKAESQFKDFKLTFIQIQNYGDANMRLHAQGLIPKSKKFIGIGKVLLDMDGNVLWKQDPYASRTYLDATKDLLYKIHYGDYAGYALKITSFLLGFITCFVIISGVMIWLTARDKKKLDPKKKHFNERVVRVYLAISLSMFPVTAATFIAVKLFPEADMSFLYTFYFLTWLVASIGLFFLDYRKIAPWCLVAGSILGLAVPVANGLVSGNWFWETIPSQFQIGFVDLLWIALASISLFAYLKTTAPKCPE